LYKPRYRKDDFAMRPIYMSVLKIVCKRKIKRRLRKNLHITILSLFGGEIIFEVFQRMWSGYLNVTDGQTDGPYTGASASPHGKTIGRQNVADIIMASWFSSDSFLCKSTCHPYYDKNAE